nr:immunoglobulin heavy chain junction region [Mus musculus]MBK4185051.1 immunoglobulin heavy chain junction region [Mus musculus]
CARNYGSSYWFAYW